MEIYIIIIIICFVWFDCRLYVYDLDLWEPKQKVTAQKVTGTLEGLWKCIEQDLVAGS